MSDARLVGQVETIRLDSVRPNGWNPNVVPPHVMASIRHGFIADGWIVSQALLVWATDEAGVARNLIIDGEHRWRCAVDVGLTEGPAVLLRGVSERDAKALTIKLNQKRGAWDEAALAALMAELVAVGDDGAVVADASLDFGFAPSAPPVAEPTPRGSAGRVAPPRCTLTFFVPERDALRLRAVFEDASGELSGSRLVAAVDAWEAASPGGA